MPEHDDALTRLVQEHVGRGRRLTFRAFEEHAVDPVTGRRISKSTAENVARGHQIKVTPEVLRAIAAGIGVDLSAVRRAAIRQYIGIEVSALNAGPGEDDAVIRVAHQVDATPEELAQARRALGNRTGDCDSQ